MMAFTEVPVTLVRSLARNFHIVARHRTRYGPDRFKMFRRRQIRAVTFVLEFASGPWSTFRPPEFVREVLRSVRSKKNNRSPSFLAKRFS